MLRPDHAVPLNAPITEGCYVRLRNGREMGPLVRDTRDEPGSEDYPWDCQTIGLTLCWSDDGVYLETMMSEYDIIAVISKEEADAVLVTADELYAARQVWVQRNGYRKLTDATLQALLEAAALVRRKAASS